MGKNKMLSYLEKNTTLFMLLFAAFLHGVLLWQFHGRPTILEVPLEAEFITTQLGLTLKTQRAPETPVVKKETIPPQQQATKSIKKITKTLTTSQPKDFQLPQAPKVTEQVKTSAVPAAAPLAKVGGGQAKPSQDEIRRYINQVVRRIDRNKRYPRISRQNGEQGTVKVKLTLGRGGELIHYTLVRETNFKRLSQATVATIQAAAPFPPLPSAYTSSQMTIEVPVRFHLARAR